MKSKSCSNERQRALPLLMTPPLGKQEPNRTECKTRKVHTMCLCKHTHAKLIFTNNRCKHARAEMNSLNHKRTRKLKKIVPVWREGTASLCSSFVPLFVKRHNPAFLLLFILPPAIIPFHFSTAYCLFTYRRADNRT